MIHENKYKAIIEWINCFPLAKPVQSLSQLSDGVSLLRLLHTKNPDLSPQEESTAARFKVIQAFLNDQYGGELATLRDDEVSLAKGTVLLLTALVQPPNINSATLAALTALPENLQLEIQDCLATLLAPLDQPDSPVVQPPNLDALLGRSCSSPRSPGTPPGRKRHPQQRGSGPFRLLSSEGQITSSPIKSFLDSPHVIRKIALKEREQEVNHLRLQLSQELNRNQDLEIDLSQAKHSIQQKEKEIWELKEALQDLKQQWREFTTDTKEEQACQNCLVSAQKLRDLEEYKSANLYLTSEMKQLTQQLEELQKQVELGRAPQPLLCQQLQQARLHNALLQGQVSDLQAQLEFAQKELASTLAFYSERSSSLSQSPHPASVAPGEILDQSLKIAELEQELSNLNNLLDNKKALAQALKEDKAVLEERVQVLSQDVAETRKQLALISEDLLRQTELNNHHVEEKKQLKVKCEALDGERHLLEQNCHNVTELKDRLMVDLAQATQNLGDLQSQIALTESRLQTSLQELESLKALSLEQEQSHKQRLELLSSENQELATTLAELETSFQIVKEEKLTLQVSLESQIHQVTTALDEKDSELKSLFAQLEHKDLVLSRNARLIQELSIKEKALMEELDSTWEKLNKELEESRESNMQLQSRLEAMTKDESDLKQQCEKETKARKSLLQEKSSLISNLNDLGSKITDVEKYADNLFSKNRELEEMVHSHTQRIGQLEKELATEKAQVSSLTQLNSGLGDSLSSHCQEIINLQESLQKARSEMDAHQEKIEELESLLASQKTCALERMEELKQEYDEDRDILNEQLKHATEVGENLKTEISSYLQELTDKSTEVARLNESMSSINVVIEKQQADLKSQQLVISKLEALNQAACKDKDEALEKIKDLQRDLKDSQSELDLLSSQISELETQLASARNNNEELVRNLSQVTIKCTESVSREESLKVKLEEATQYFEESRTNFEKERNLNFEELSQISEEMLHLNTQKRTLETQLLFMQECNSQMKEKMQDLEKDFTHLVTTNESLENVIKENERKITIMDAALSSLRSYSSELDRKIIQLKQVLSEESTRGQELEKENNSLLGKYAECHDVISLLETDLKLVREEKESLSGSLAEKELCLSSSLEELKEKQATIGQLSSTIDSLKEESSLREEALCRCQSTISQLEELALKRESVESELQECQAHLEAQRQNLESQIHRLKHEVASRVLEVETLRVDQKSKQGRLLELQELVVQLQEVRSQQEMGLSEKEQALAEANARMEQQSCQLQDLEHQLAGLRQEHDGLLRVKQDVESRHEELQSLCQKLEMKLAALDGEKDGLVKQVQDAETRLLSKESQIEEVMSSLHSLGMELGEVRGRLEEEQSKNTTLQDLEQRLRVQLAGAEAQAREQQEAAQNKLQATLAETEDLRHSKSSLQHQLSLLKADAEKTHQQLAEARDQAHGLSLTVNSLQLRQVTLEESLAAQKMLLSQTEYELESSQQQALAAQKHLLSQLEEQAEQHTKKVDALTQTLCSTEKRLKEELAAKDKEHQAKVTILEEELLRQSNNYNAIKHQAEEREAQALETLKDLQHQTDVQLESVRQQLAEKEKLATERLVKYEKAKKYIAQMDSHRDKKSEGEMKELQHGLEKARSQLTQKDSILHKLAQEKRSLEAQLAFSDSQIRELRGKLDPSSRRHTLLHPSSTQVKETPAVKKKDPAAPSDNWPTPELTFLSTTKDKENMSFNTTLNSSVIPAEMAGKFECEDEEGEFMDPRHLAGLKSGEMGLMTPNERRLTELQRRNTLCLPHLRSSYPAEMQSHLRLTEKNVLKEANPRTLLPANKRKHNVQGPAKDKGGAFKMAKDTVPLTRFQPRSSAASLRPEASQTTTTPNTRSRKSNFKTPNTLKRLFHRKKQ